VQNDMSNAVMWSKSKPDVEFKYAGRLGEFNGMSSQSHLPNCRVLPPGEFNVMIPGLRVIAWCCHRASSMACHLRATHHIAGCCHLVNSLSRFQSHNNATCHIAGCSHLTKSMSLSCHIAGCKNSIRHIENRFSSYFIFSFLMQFRL